MTPPLFHRHREVTRTRSLLEKLGSPRAHMSLIVALTAAVGFLASSLLRRGGMEAMVLRYPLAVLIAYLVFLGLLGAWLHYGGHYQNQQSESADGLDAAEFMVDAGRMASPHDSVASSSADSGAWQAIGEVGDGEGLLLGLAIAAVVALLFAIGAAFFVVAGAPALMAELLVDVALARGLFKRVRSIDGNSHWLRTAFSKTVWRVTTVALGFSLAGWLLQHFVPTASTLGDAFR